jgi:GAF domain-containing protein
VVKFTQKEALTELARATRETVGSLVVLITEVLPSHEAILAKSGPTFPLPATGIIPLDHSICQHVVAMDYPLVIEDALTHPLVLGNKAVEQLGVLAYLGAPIYQSGLVPIGAVCAIETRRRRWSDEDIEAIKLAAGKATEILRA